MVAEVGVNENTANGEVNSVDMLKSGTSYVSHDFENTAQYSGSYAPVVKGVHQCGGSKSRKNRKRQNKTQKRPCC